MKNVDIFYFDIDGTLFDHQNDAVDPSVFNAINALKEEGYHVALCTGRTMDGLQKPSLINEVEWDGYVLANGGQVFNKDLKQIRKVVCEPQFIRDFIKYNEGALFLEGDENYVTEEPDQKALDGFAYFGVRGKDLPPRVDYTDQTVYKFVCFHMDSFRKNAPEGFLDDYFALKNAAGNYEIFPKATTKYHGIEALNEYLGVSSYAGFGDGSNDVEFLEHADFSIAMGNATDELKEIADVVTDSVQDNGVATAINKFVFDK